MKGMPDINIINIEERLILITGLNTSQNLEDVQVGAFLWRGGAGCEKCPRPIKTLLAYHFHLALCRQFKRVNERV